MQMGNYIDFTTNQKLQKEKVYIKYREKSQKPKWFLHSHDGYEIYYFQEGSAFYIVGDSVYQLIPGDLLLFNGGILHRVNPSQDVPYIRSFINFVPAYLESIVSEKMAEKLISPFQQTTGQLIRLDMAEREEIDRLYWLMFDERTKETVGFEEMFQSYFTQLLVKIYRKLARNDGDRIRPNGTQKEVYVHRILDFVNSNYKEEVTLDQIADALHMNKYYMCHSFKELTGFTINKYVAKVRIDEAKKLLRTTDEPIGNISDTVGMKTAVHFSRLFKQFEGTSPNEYRKKKQNQSGWGDMDC